MFSTKAQATQATPKMPPSLRHYDYQKYMSVPVVHTNVKFLLDKQTTHGGAERPTWWEGCAARTRTLTDNEDCSGGASRTGI